MITSVPQQTITGHKTINQRLMDFQLCALALCTFFNLLLICIDPPLFLLQSFLCQQDRKCTKVSTFLGPGREIKWDTHTKHTWMHLALRGQVGVAGTCVMNHIENVGESRQLWHHTNWKIPSFLGYRTTRALTSVYERPFSKQGVGSSRNQKWPFILNFKTTLHLGLFLDIWALNLFPGFEFVPDDDLLLCGHGWS